MASQTKTKSNHHLRKVLIYIGLIIGLLLFIYFIIYRPYITHQEKKRFEQAEASLNELYDKIVATIGNPDQEKKDKSCSYASRVFERGPRSCSVGTFLLYSPLNLIDSNNSMSSISKMIGTTIYNRSGEYDYLGRSNPRNFVEYSGSGSSQEFSQDLNIEFGKISCSISYKYPVILLFDKEFSELAKENLQIALICGGPASSELYPVN